MLIVAVHNAQKLLQASYAWFLYLNVTKREKEGRGGEGKGGEGIPRDPN